VIIKEVPTMRVGQTIKIVGVGAFEGETAMVKHVTYCTDGVTPNFVEVTNPGFPLPVILAAHRVDATTR
jgi:transcription antitermination factor NusG